MEVGGVAFPYVSVYSSSLKFAMKVKAHLPNNVEF